MEILMLSYWDFQEKGIQVIKNTPLYFAKRGHNVKFFINPEQTYRASDIVNLHPRIEVFRFNLPFKFLCKIPKIKRIRQLIFFAIFSIYYANKIYRRREGPDLIYAAECDAILVGYILQHIYKVPFVTRYYGISEILLEKPFRHLFYFLSLKCPADLAIVTNDGTNGYEILSKLNRRIKSIKFWRNGLNQITTDQNEILRIRQKYKIKSDDFVLVKVGRLYSWKRIDRTIRVMYFLASDIKRSYKLLLIGEGKERENLEILAKKLGVSDNIIFVGSVEHVKIYNYYTISDLVLSLHDMANAGNPLYEALNIGKCVITLNIGGANEVITNGENGIIIDINNDEDEMAKELASIVKSLLMNKKYRKKLEKGAKDYAKNNLCTWDERLKEELNNIEELVKNFKR